MVTGRKWRSGFRALLAGAAIVAVALPFASQAQTTGAQAVQAKTAARTVETPAEKPRTKFVIGLEHTVEFQVFALTTVVCRRPARRASSST
jgi:hypothetical protein